MRLADAVVVLLTQDDVGYVQPRFRLAGDGRHELEPTGQPQLSVVFEAGMAMARDRDKVVLVEVGPVRPMSDTTGLNVVRLGDDAATRRHSVSACEPPAWMSTWITTSGARPGRSANNHNLASLRS